MSPQILSSTDFLSISHRFAKVNLCLRFVGLVHGHWSRVGNVKHRENDNVQDIGLMLWDSAVTVGGTPKQRPAIPSSPVAT